MNTNGRGDHNAGLENNYSGSSIYVDLTGGCRMIRLTMNVSHTFLAFLTASNGASLRRYLKRF
jgi:hypothetical protein